MKKIKWKNIIILILLIIFLYLFISSLINIINWKKDSDNTKNIISDIENIIEIEEVKDEDIVVEIVPQEKEIDKYNPYWDYIKMNLINVKFDELKKINSDTIGWITVNGTNINYPFVQAKNNDYYLNHSFDKTYNESGWVFLDYRNKIDLLDKNTIIYAHGRTEGTMFGSLKNILNNNWISNKDNYVVKLSTENHNTLWQIFSVYRIPTTNDYIKVDFFQMMIL